MEGSGFYSILFHALYQERDKDKPKHPYMYVSVREFDESIKFLLDNGFEFLDPAALHNTSNHHKQILLTFDDGYYNNIYALEVLEKYSIKALFFFVSHQVIQQKYFWWDSLFLNRIKKVSFDEIFNEIQRLKKLKRASIEKLISDKFGKDCFKAEDDFYRPMTVKELRDFAQHPLVEIGVHSASHEVLTNLSGDELKDEISGCKKFLEQTVGKELSFISYPNGNFNDEIIFLSKALGFEYGITTLNGFNSYDKIKEHDENLILKRFSFPITNSEITVTEQIRDFVLNEKKTMHTNSRR